MTGVAGAGNGRSRSGRPVCAPSDAPAARAVAPVRVVVRGSAGWPERLEHLPDPPEGIWLAGRGTLQDRVVAVVGARRATLAGLAVARDLARDLAAAGVQVVSGMARGIDAAAHRGALEGGGSTVAVLGCGVDVCYPLENRPLRDAIRAHGLVVAEDPPGTEPAPWRFPRRNRLIAALALAVVVVEAGERSGALSTARHAADMGREVLAVPGSVRSPQSVGANRLIRDGAVPLLETADLLAAVPALAPPTAGGRVRRDREGPPLAPALEGLLDLLGPDPAHPDALAAAARRPAAEVAAQLSTLEVLGLVAAVPGGVVRLGGAGR